MLFSGITPTHIWICIYPHMVPSWPMCVKWKKWRFDNKPGRRVIVLKSSHTLCLIGSYDVKITFNVWCNVAVAMWCCCDFIYGRYVCWRHNEHVKDNRTGGFSPGEGGGCDFTPSLQNIATYISLITSLNECSHLVILHFKIHALLSIYSIKVHMQLISSR